jgi:rhodanese-related sulfurtransferase
MLRKTFLAAFTLLLLNFSLSAQNTYNEISLWELVQKLQAGEKDLVVLDVRSREEYADTSAFKHLNIGRIKGSINIPIQELQQNPEAIKQLEGYKNKDIYVICSHSYRSRAISNLLLKNNYSSVNNVMGGMSEWFRDYDQLRPYAAAFYQESIPYNNISPSQLYSKIRNNDPVLFIGFKNAPKSFFDSLVRSYVDHLGEIKHAEYFTSADSALVLAKAKAAEGKAIITFNMMGTGAGEIANWLSQNGIKNVNYLIGNLTGFYEYLENFQFADKTENYITPKNKIRFYTGQSLCRVLEKPNSLQLVDLRHDTTFAKPTVGTKLTYKTIRSSVNFPFYRSAAEFMKQFPDKGKQYVLLPQQGYVGMELADALLANGYNVGWLMGGIERFEWYNNNVRLFYCKNFFE